MDETMPIPSFEWQRSLGGGWLTIGALVFVDTHVFSSRRRGPHGCFGRCETLNRTLEHLNVKQNETNFSQLGFWIHCCSRICFTMFRAAASRFATSTTRNGDFGRFRSSSATSCTYSWCFLTDPSDWLTLPAYPKGEWPRSLQENCSLRYSFHFIPTKPWVWAKGYRSWKFGVGMALFGWGRILLRKRFIFVFWCSS